MEKFAVDLDKVLDDFELDEDESVSVSQYDKLQLEFRHDGASAPPPAASRHALGLGAFGGWSEPLPQVVGGGQQQWCRTGAGHPPAPPGTRSPPDGQNDDSHSSVACSNPSQGFHANAQYPPPQPVPQPHLPTFPPFDTTSNGTSDALTGPTQPGELLWPAMAGSIAARPSLNAPQVAEEADSSKYNAVPPVDPAAHQDMRAPDMIDNPAGVACGGVDVISSRPLDVVPGGGASDANHDARHPDIIDVWQSTVEGGQGEAGREAVQEERGVEVERGPDPGDHRLLPDLMSMNGVEGSGNNEGAVGGADYPEPAIVKENTLSDLQMNEPAIVMESQSCSRIPEVVNVHQTAENQQLQEERAAACSDDSLRPSFEAAPSCDRVPGVVQDHINPVCDNIDTRPPPTVAAEGEPVLQGALPDVSDVSPAPIAFNKNLVIDDADLEAELAELEEEQYRLQGAYGGQIYPADNQAGPESGNESGLVGGLDLIGDMATPQTNKQKTVESASEGVGSGENIPEHTRPAEDEADSGATCEGAKALESSLEASGEQANESTNQTPIHQVSREETLTLPDHTEVGTVEEVICKPQSSDIPQQTNPSPNQGGEQTTNPNEAGDNLSTNSTGTDTLSSSSTLTDGEVGSPERQPAAPEPQPESPSRTTPGSLVTAVYDDDSGSGREDDLSPDAGAVGGAAITTGSMVGHVAPFWIPDEEAANCQECGQKFTVIRRRHHCRACGRVLCAQCCHDKAQLPYMDYKEARVCGSCLHLILQGHEEEQSRSGRAAEAQRRLPDPNNPMDYCSRVPPPQQVSSASAMPPPTVMVPVGVLKREGGSSSARSRGSKQVIFSDGIRPGGDLSEGDGSGQLPPPYRRSGRSARRVNHPSTEYVFEENPDGGRLEGQIRGDGPPVVFAVHKNLTVLVKMVKLECCVGLEVWNIATRGLCTVGQEELVVLLEVSPGETHPPKDVFAFFHTVYQQANQGNLVTELGHTIFTEPEGFLGSREHGGFLYIRPTFQCLRNLVLPPSPYIFAVLIQKWETPWAKVFPLRLMLRMGAEFRYYPCPLVSTRNRKPVFCEIGHTIMNLLVDFRNYTYTIPAVEGFVIHMEDKKTTLLFPKNRYEQVAKALSNSNDHVLALAANFSPQADSHLVTIEDDNGHYSTQAINIHNRPRKVTGASFIVFNGALKTTSGLSAKSSIVEDGLMVQIPSDMMTQLREALRNMKNFRIPCGPASAAAPDEVVSIEWTSDDKNFNVGIKSPVDERKMDGVPSYKIHTGTDYVSNAHLIRWTEVFIMQGESNTNSDVNLSRLSEVLARAFCVALTPHLADLYSGGLARLGLRATVHQDNVGYEAGSNGTRLPSGCMNDLDTELIPVIHRAASTITDQPIILELLFHIMEQ